ncbi:MAG: glycosyltransferase [Candidatus Aenigmatarchaeota archaeon]
MKKLPFVSVIVPTLNEEKYIENCLKALRAQDYEGKYEIIVADGLSEDKTVEKAKKYADKVVSVKKKGIGAGRNAGAKEAKGEIFVFVDADTIAPFNLLTELVKCFKKGVVGATCPILPLSDNMSEFVFYWFYDKFMRSSLKEKPKVAGICCAYKRDAFEKVKGFDEKLKVCEDFDLSERISKFGKIVCTDSTFILASPRRIRKWGKTKAAMKYIKFYLNYLLDNKLAEKIEYELVR